MNGSSEFTEEVRPCLKDTLSLPVLWELPDRSRLDFNPLPITEAVVGRPVPLPLPFQIALTFIRFGAIFSSSSSSSIRSSLLGVTLVSSSNRICFSSYSDSILMLCYSFIECSLSNTVLADNTGILVFKDEEGRLNLGELVTELISFFSGI